VSKDMVFFLEGDIFGLKVKYYKKECKSLGFEGYFNSDEKIICIDESLKGDCLQQVILHEEFEALYYRIAGNQSGIDNGFKEMIIDSIATFVSETYDLSRKNKRHKKKKKG